METIKDSEFINALIAFVVISFMIGIGVILLYLHFQKNLLYQKLEQERLKNNHQHELMRSNLETQEEERKLIAQDLHDELGAMLSIMNMNLMMMERKSEASSHTQLPELKNILSLSKAALTSTRHISHRLMPPQLEEFGLAEALKSMTEQMNTEGLLTINLDTAQELDTLPHIITLSLYRIIMELINNTIKHAGATYIHIHIAQQERQLICRFSDNGIGIAPNTDMNNGMGQKSINTRVLALGGTFAMDRTQRQGYHACIHIPI